MFAWIDIETDRLFIDLKEKLTHIYKRRRMFKDGVRQSVSDQWKSWKGFYIGLKW